MARTHRTEVAGVRLWRWRRSPLRRHSDIVEAWIVLAVWLLALVGGAVAGLAAAEGVDQRLAARRAQVHSVSAVLTEDAAKAAPAATGYDDGLVWAPVRWTASDGSVHTDRAKAAPGAVSGTRVTVWTDGRGRVVSKPLSVTEATLQAAGTGALVAPIAATVVWAGGRLVRGRLLRRRLAEWDEEWKRVGPQWRNLSGGRG